MSQTLVALDLETTGLESDRDAIIEIGAIKFKGERIEGEFQQLINPGRSIPRNISELTGITDAMVTNAPRLNQVLPKLEAFVGEATALGHNVQFDLGFLRAKGILKHNEQLDTYPLAAVLLPTAARYNLGALGKELGILLPATHRALDDCRVTVAVYQALMRYALTLPLELLAEISNVGQDLDWGANQFFEDVLRARSKETVAAKKANGALGPLFNQDKHPPPPLKPAETPRPLNTDELTAVLEPGGAFSKHFPGYEFRSEQVEMLRAVARAFSQGRHLMVEAGTGTGKSFGYLIPAAHWAMQNGERVVVSTNTINLQEQLVNKDVPDLQAALGLDFRAALLKGRSNYLCPRRLENMRRYRPRTADEMRVLAKVLVWLSQHAAERGNRAEISLGPIDRFAWTKLSAEDENCTLDTCQTRMQGACPFYQARKAAENAHIIIANHALLLADIATDNRVLPAYKYLVLDEAHHLEAATTDGLSFEAGRIDLERQLKDLGGPNSGLLGQILSAAHTALPPDHYLGLELQASEANDRATTAMALAREFFDSIANFLDEQRDGKPIGDYGQQVRIVAATRALPHWSQIEIQWDQLRPSLTKLAETTARIRQALVELVDYDIDRREELASTANMTARYFTKFVENLTGLVFKPDPAIIYWIEAQSRDGRISLHAAPLNVGPLVEKNFWNAKESVVMTSATLTTGGEFDYLQGRLNAREVDEVALGSPFNYEASTLLYLVSDIPEPVDRFNYQKGVEKGVLELCKATRGRALVLFTSYAQLKQTAQAVRDPLRRAGIEVYDQLDGSSRSTLLESFKTSEGGVLLGTKSFWEGVDVPGEALSVLVLTKLPFDVPSDPIIAARAETFERPFDEYSVPEAVLKFRQGFGRLIRSKSDRGVVVVLDRRVLSKGYGRIFTDSLPRCTLRRAPLAQLPKDAARWIDGA